jgi:hypothetical protein
LVQKEQPGVLGAAAVAAELPVREGLEDNSEEVGGMGEAAEAAVEVVQDSAELFLFRAAQHLLLEMGLFSTEQIP